MLSEAEVLRVRTELAAIRAQRREQFEMLAAFGEVEATRLRPQS